jgi:RNA polymerase sigma-70 factor (ECF subfamily)
MQGFFEELCGSMKPAPSSSEPPMPAPVSFSPEAPRDAAFHTTRWSLVTRAGAEAGAALGELCAKYWYPLYCCVRRHGYSPEDAQDLTQGFFAKLLRHESFADADPAKGRFRTWLARSLEHHLRNEHRNASAAKRGGGVVPISWDAREAEERFALEPASDGSPERMFERQWAQTLLYTVLERVRREFGEGGKAELFDALEPHLWSDETSTPYAVIGERLQMTVVALRVTLHRLRRRFHELLREEIAATLERDADVDDELACLQRSLAGP